MTATDLTAAPTFVPRSGDTWDDPFTMYRALRDHDPVHHAHYGDHDYWVLSRFQDIFDAARDAETFSSAEGLTFNYNEREQAGLDEASPIVMMDPPEHTVFRRLVARGFTPRAVSEIEPALRSFARGALDRVCEAGGGDIVAELFKPYPSFIVAHYLGVPFEDRGRFDYWTDAIVAGNADGNLEEASDAVMELMGYFSDLIERRRAEPTDDMTSALVHAELDGAEVPIMKILGFTFTMVAGGNDTTTGLLGGTTMLLDERRDQRQLLVDDPSKITNAAEELLRLTSPVQGLARMTTRDVEMEGVTIPAGRKVMLLYGSGNRDEREYGPDAAELDVERKIDKILTFGYGAHHCLGAAVARLAGRVAIEELLDRCPDYSVDVGGAHYAGGNFVRRLVTLPFSPTS